ncbi:Binding protein [Quillaja saponaria]|uniref:Binding protein n=1 Tax=Quillaja saponaria TaxID=32244 RepID=A0AAD7Q1B6_QUISA|nr:Binding protein [Quillaja saponaria]
MEGVSVRVYNGLRKYWSRRGYRRLNGSGRRRRSKIELGSSSTQTRRKRFWKIKITPKIRFSKMGSAPNKFLVWLRDSYVKMMMGLANSPVMSSASGYGYGNGGGALGGREGDGICVFERAPVKEYDEKMIVQIYKSLVMVQGPLVPRDAPRKASQISSRR